MGHDFRVKSKLIQPEYGSSTLRRNVGKLIPDCMASYSRTRAGESFAAAECNQVFQLTLQGAERCFSGEGYERCAH